MCRVERLEQRRCRLPGPWQAELLALERDYAKQFPMPIGNWSDHRCESYIAYQASGTARRLNELRWLAKPRQERAALAVELARMQRMSADEVATYMAAMDAADVEEPTWQR